MTTIRKLISAWMQALVGSVLLPVVSIAAVSGTTYDAPSTTTTASATIAEHTASVETVRCAETSLRSTESDQTRSLLGLSCGLDAPKTTAGMGPGLETRGLRPTPGTRVRPEGIPDTWKIRPTRGDGGVQYYNPANPNQNIRVMQGNPNSPYPNSQGPYVRQQNAGGIYLRQDGTPSPLQKGGLKDPDTHIPLDQFIFRQ